MTSGGAIFLLQGDKTLKPMREAAYDSEDLLQALLAEYPELLAGEQMDRTTPRRWILVRREAGVPSDKVGADRWSMDHLFLDQDGVPTIVEVKRSTDTRLRREVVGQMLDYAANSVSYWPVSRIRAMFEETCGSASLDPSAEVEKLLDAGEGAGEAVDQFWQNVERNFQAHRLRMVFVADVIPPELQRIVEFLNEQMRPADVLAVEVRQYVGDGAKTLVPRLFGLTAEAQIKHPPTPPSTDEATFLQSLPDDYAGALKSSFETCRSSGLTVYWGAVGCSIRTTARGRPSLISIAWVYPPGRPGWASLTDVTLGVDRSSAAYYSPHLLQELDEYARRASSLPGARAVTTTGMSAWTFSPADFLAAKDRVVELIVDTGKRLRSPGPSVEAESGQE